jgi:hypothetical protein
MSEIYNVVALSTHLEPVEEININPIVATYLPDQILKKHGWSKDTALILIDEDDRLTIKELTQPLIEGELTYELDPE